jgi:TPR repeat protein
LVLGVLFAGAAKADSRVAAGLRAYASGRYALAAQLLTPPAAAGDATAETYLGFIFQKGRGVPKNYAEAARWFYAAASQGEPTAQFFLALLFDRGLGVTRSFVQAYAWLDLAAAGAPARQRDYWAKMRDAVANKLSYDELAEAQAQALAFAPPFDP